jgi:hypothetical protein
MPRYTTSITCVCGAKYERGEAHLPIRDVGMHECSHCGVVIERWQGRTVPIFRFVSAPETDAASAA